MRFEGIAMWAEPEHIIGLRYGASFTVEVVRGSIEPGQTVSVGNRVRATVGRMRVVGDDELLQEVFGRPIVRPRSGARLRLFFPELSPTAAASLQMHDIDGFEDDGTPASPVVSPWAAVMRCVRDELDAKTLACILATTCPLANGVDSHAFFEPHTGQRDVGAALSWRITGSEDHYIDIGAAYETTDDLLADFVARCSVAGVTFDPVPN